MSRKAIGEVRSYPQILACAKDRLDATKTEKIRPMSILINDSNRLPRAATSSAIQILHQAFEDSSDWFTRWVA